MSILTTELLFEYFVDFAPLLVSVLLLWTGISCLRNPIGLAQTFGIPNATPSEVVFFQSSTGRNMAAAVFIWVLVYLQERRILGYFFLCWTWAGVADTKLLYEHSRGEKLLMHMRNVFVLSLLGPLLIRSSKG
ncbi:hypothetical protein BDV95DRAFT_624969 [Massariosphaeria phaeospora]|uniref:Uncharacterized protein n=1 Tax=Massariosphaeria phaeospora TaxID=100035 RepID=A0A7C8MZ67_9PLEO|nr:hypothetical protein BDV95DRAFT_624969 [Massariosphaeria phaeospora]